MTVGILSLQGDVELHQFVLSQLGIKSAKINKLTQLDDISSLIIPGGESTTMSKLLISSGIYEQIVKRIKEKSIAIFGTCAGMILLANKIYDGREDQISFNAINVGIKRNAFGRQIESTFKTVVIRGDSEIEPSFIRAPRIADIGDDVEVLGTLKQTAEPVLVTQGKMLASSFHPELSKESCDNIVHRIFLEIAEEK
jgi:5'-phosphate synthase pdxT subunit